MTDKQMQTDKEQIIIDGCDVSECEFYQIEANELYPKAHYCGSIKNTFCEDKPECYFKQLARKTQECKQKEKEINELHLIIDRLLEASGYDKNISTAEDFEDVYADIDYKLGLLDELKQECEELKKANLHIDTNRQCKGSKLKRIEDLISACEAGYTDEFIQKIYGIIQEPEPTINDYSITDRYREALEEIEQELKEDIYCESQECGCDDFEECLRCTKNKILDIINKAKEEE